MPTAWPPTVSESLALLASGCIRARASSPPSRESFTSPLPITPLRGVSRTDGADVAPGRGLSFQLRYSERKVALNDSGGAHRLRAGLYRNRWRKLPGDRRGELA